MDTTNSKETIICPACSTTCSRRAVCPTCGHSLWDTLEIPISDLDLESVFDSTKSHNPTGKPYQINEGNQPNVSYVTLNTLDVRYNAFGDGPNTRKKYEAICYFFDPTDDVVSYLNGDLIKSKKNKKSHNLDIKAVQILNYDQQNSTIPIQQISQTSFDPKSYIVSDSDEELLILIEFQREINLKSITLYALPNALTDDQDDIDASPPKLINIYKTKHLNIDFDDIDEMTPHLTINCVSQQLETGQLIKLQKKSKAAVKFKKIRYLIVYVKSNQNDTEQTYLNNIAFNLSTECVKSHRRDLQLQQQTFNKCDSDQQSEYNEMLQEYQKDINIDDIHVERKLLKTLTNQLNIGSCCDFNCVHMKRITDILRKYHLFIAEQEEIAIDNIYPNTSYNDMNLVNDFNHLLFQHDGQFEDICHHLITKSNNKLLCDLSKCQAFRRNHRNRLCTPSFPTDNYSESCVKIELLDKIHSHYFHTFDSGLRLTRNDIKQINTKCDEYKRDTDDFISDQVISETSELIQQRKKSINNDLDESLCGSNKFSTESNGAPAALYSFGIKFFYWDYYKGNNDVYDVRLNFNRWDYMKHGNNGYTLKDWYIPNKYQTLKEEMLQNIIATLSIADWKRLCEAANIHINSDHGRSFKNRYSSFTFDNAAAQYYGIKSQDKLTAKHLIAIMIYCNFDEFQTKFSATFRRIPHDETDEHIKSRHSNFVNLAKLLRELECFTNNHDDEPMRIGTLYHGVSVDIMFQTMRAQINGPFSTTTDYAVAVNFCQNKGVILELTAEHDWCCRILAPCFSCNWISNYPNEQERFFIGGSGYFQFQNFIRVSLNQNYQFYVDALLLICEAFDFTTYTQRKTLNGLQKQMMFRLISHELYQYNPENYHEFKSIPKYIEALLHNHFQHIIQMDWKPIFKVFNVLFFYDYGWIKLDLLTKMCPKLKRFRLSGYEVTICDSIFVSFLSYLQNHPNTCLGEISMLGALDENKMSIQEAIEKYRSPLKNYNWMIYEQESSYGPHLVMESAYSDAMKTYFRMNLPKSVESQESANN